MSDNGLRLALAKAIQQYRLTRMMPLYGDAELADVVDAWIPYLQGVNPAFMPDLWMFALARRDAKKPFGAEDLREAWPEFGRRKKDAIMQDYYDELDKATAEVERLAAKQWMEKRLRDLGL